MKFTKMHGLGNDYIYVNGFTEDIPDPKLLPALAARLSDRHMGIGSDGLILIRPGRRADFGMEMYNADGSVGKMCGNGIRCVGKYVFDHGLTDQRELSVETAAGVKNLKLFVDKGEVRAVRVDMGSPVTEARRIPVLAEREIVVNDPVDIGGSRCYMTCISMGNPHAVVFVGNVDEVRLEEIGPKFEYHRRFPDRINTEFVQVEDRHTVKMRVWERGSGETLACGTGACAAVAAGVLNDLTDHQVQVKLRGGNLFVEWDEEAGHIYMTGPAVTVFDGEIGLDGII